MDLYQSRVPRSSCFFINRRLVSLKGKHVTSEWIQSSSSRSKGNYPSSLADPRLFSSRPHEMFYNHQGRIGLFSPPSPSALAGHPFQDHGGHSDGWQHVTGRRKR